MAGVTSMLLLAASQGQGSMAEALLLRQLASTVKVVMEMHQAVGDLQRASQIDRTLREQYTLVRDRLPAIVKLEKVQQAKSMPAPAAGLDPELAKALEAAHRGEIVPGTGSPVPIRLRPAEASHHHYAERARPTREITKELDHD
jgi:hypothetical protein